MAASVHLDTRTAAANYADTTGQAQHGNFQKLLEAMEISPGGRVLDVGCGPGTQALQVAKLVGPEGKVIGYDLSDQRINEARDRTVALNNGRRDAGERPLNVIFGVASGDNLPTDMIGPVTDVFSNSATHWFPDLKKFYAGCFKVLEHGGRVGTLGSVGAHAAPRNEVLGRAPFNVLPVRSATNFRTPGQHKAAAEAVGFINCKVSLIESKRRFPGGATEIIQFLQDSSSNDFLDVEYLPEELRDPALEAIRNEYVGMQASDGSITLQNDLVLLIADKPYDIASEPTVPLYQAHLTVEIQDQFRLGFTPALEKLGRSIYYKLERDVHFTREKISTYPRDDAVFQFWDFIQHQDSIRQSNEYKENVLLGQLPLCSVLKWVQSNSANRLIGKPRSSSMLYLRGGPATQTQYLSMDGTEISNSRTFWPVLQLFELRYAGQGVKRILCIVGTGPVVEAGIRQFANQFADDIDRIILISTPKPEGETPSAQRLAEKLKDLPVKIEPYTDKSRMLAADMVVTATDAYRQIIDEENDLRPAVMTVATSAMEFSLGYIADLVAKGQHLVVETDVEDTLKRRMQALSEYFIAQAGTIEEQATLARASGVLSLSQLKRGDLDDKKTVHASVIGHVGQDAVGIILIAMQFATEFGSGKFMGSLKRMLGLPRNWTLPDDCKIRASGN